MASNNSQQPHDYQDVFGAILAVESSGSSTSSSSSSPTGFSYNAQPYGFQQVSDNSQGNIGNFQAGAQTFDQHGYRFDCAGNERSYVGQPAYSQQYETYNHPTISQSQYSCYSSSQGSPHQSQYGAYPTPGCVYLQKRDERSSSDSSTDMDQSGRIACKNKRGPKGPKLSEMKDLEKQLKKETVKNYQLKVNLETKTKEKDSLFSKVVNLLN